jgi:replicative DNA helicase
VTKEKTPIRPHNLDAERSVLGAILLHAESALPRSRPYLDDDAFYHPAHKAIWQAIIDAEEHKIAVDAVSVLDALRRLDLVRNLKSEGGEDYLTTLQFAVITVENVEHHAQIVARKANRRHAAVALSELAHKGLGESDDDEFFAEFEKLILDLGTRRRSLTRAAKLVETLTTFRHELEARYERSKLGLDGPLIVGVPTGFPNVDKLTGGWRKGDQIVIAARPSMGKTAWVMNAVTSAAMHFGVHALVVSAEMSAMQLVERMVASHGRVDTLVLRNGTLVEADWRRVTKAATDLSELPIEIIDEAGLTIADVQSRARRWRATTAKNAEQCVIVVDYLQLLEPTNAKQQREQQVSEISRGLKRLAKECGCPVISLAQLNRQLESRDDKRPRMSDLRDSGSIEQDADIVAFLYRDGVYDKSPENPQRDIAELIVGKFRGGPLATLWFDWDGQHTTFVTRWEAPPPKGGASGGKKAHSQREPGEHWQDRDGGFE